MHMYTRGWEANRLDLGYRKEKNTVAFGGPGQCADVVCLGVIKQRALHFTIGFEQNGDVFCPS